MILLAVLPYPPQQGVMTEREALLSEVERLTVANARLRATLMARQDPEMREARDAAIVRAYDDGKGLSMREVGNQFGVSKPLVHALVKAERERKRK